jgi:hypothetical protein
MASIESQKKDAISLSRLRPLVERLISKIIESPATVRGEVKALFPSGISLIPPKGSEGPWQVNLTVDGASFICLDTHRRGNADNSRPRNSKPPDRSEGREFTESALGSALRHDLLQSHVHRATVYIGVHHAVQLRTDRCGPPTARVSALRCPRGALGPMSR